MGIWLAILSVIFGTLLGGILGFAGGFVGGGISGYFDVLNQAVEFNRLERAMDYGHAAKGLGAVAGLISGGLIGIAGSIAHPIITIAGSGVIFAFLSVMLEQSVGQSIIGLPGGFILGAILGAIGGYIGRYFAACLLT